MATDQQTIDPLEASDDNRFDSVTSLPAAWYDRSSLRGDFLVLIPDQPEEEFLRRWPERPRCEFIDGTVYMHAEASNAHQFDVQFMLALILMYDAVRPSGVILTGPAALRLRDGCYLEPDIFIMPPGYVREVGDKTTAPPARLVVEVLSPSTRNYDLRDKTALYREADTVDYWVIDGRDKVLIVDRRSADGRDSFRVESGLLRSTGLPGFWIEVDWLWADPRPNLMRCFEQILAGPPS